MIDPQAAPGGPEPLSDRLAEHLPRLRRYARALTGRQQSGDAYAVATLEALVAARDEVRRAPDPRVLLFRTFHDIWETTGQPADPDPDPDLPLPERRAQARLAALTPQTREALILHTIERFGFDEIGEIMGTDGAEARLRVQTAREEMADAVSGRVLIIEDEAIIAMDLESLVVEAGHEVTGIARTRAGAVKLGLRDKPDLILADIQLADNSSGLDAVHDILAQFGDIPVLFITAFPERLLTGERPEPAFLIAKPFDEEQVRTAISQALFFSSTATLEAESA
ncbi:response regulator [Rhodovulum sp. 12E13]|uniref:response regulator n=1 Tax=Rhodovulum sp. 12E13 TaxID=2203891 RepID=UPI000E131863|nr:response regulator [Rhodovulum sp. 12E13]RDC72353.1 response regulator [Rhodovulum sp. 12E13]